MQRRNIILTEAPAGTSVLFPDPDDVFGMDFPVEYVLPVLTLDCTDLGLPFSDRIPLVAWGEPGFELLELGLDDNGRLSFERINRDAVEGNEAAASRLHATPSAAFEDPELNADYRARYGGRRLSARLGAGVPNDDVFACESELQAELDLPVGTGAPFWAQGSPIEGGDDDDARFDGFHFFAGIDEGCLFGYYFYYFNPETRRVRAYFQCT